MLPEQASSQPSYVRLSELIQQLEANTRNAFLRHYRQALRSGNIKAIPLTDTYTFEGQNRRKGEARSSTRQDEAILSDSSFTKWFERTRHTLTNPKIGLARSVAVSFEDLLSGEINFEQCSAQYRKKLQPQKSIKRQRPKAFDTRHTLL